MTPEFNLLEEKWIKVLCEDYTIKEVSLTDALVNAHTYRDLAGESKTQDVAILRLLLAVLHSVFSQTNAEGKYSPIEDQDDALDRWSDLWKMSRFPAAPVTSYLEQYREHFFLFHPENPFYQVPAFTDGTAYTVSKLNGILSESGNKKRWFSDKNLTSCSNLGYSESARWLVHLMCCDDSSGKAARGLKLPSVGVGWLGKLGLVIATGENLFETLMLNFTLLKDGETVWSKNRPCWELDHPKTDERTEIPVPDNQAELLTLQSRRIMLIRDENSKTVIGYRLKGGDFFNSDNAFTEQMTTWGTKEDKKTGTITFYPKKHDSARKIWRDFNSLAVQAEADKSQSRTRIPGVLKWIGVLKENGILPNSMIITIQTPSVEYDSKNCSIEDMTNDSLSFAADLLSKKGQIWQKIVMDEIERCEKRAYYLSTLAYGLTAAGGSAKSICKKESDKAKESYFEMLDLPFRRWLRSLAAGQDGDERHKKQLEWSSIADKTARKLGRALRENAGRRAETGCIDRSTGSYRSASKSWQKFECQMSKVSVNA